MKILSATHRLEVRVFVTVFRQAERRYIRQLARALENHPVDVTRLYSGRTREKLFKMDLFGDFEHHRGRTSRHNKVRIDYILTQTIMQQFAPVSLPPSLHWHPYLANVLPPILDLPPLETASCDSIFRYRPLQTRKRLLTY